MQNNLGLALDIVMEGYSRDQAGLMAFVFDRKFLSEEQIRKLLTEVHQVNFSQLSNRQISVAKAAVDELFKMTNGQIPNLDSIRRVIYSISDELYLRLNDRAIGNLALFIYNNWEELIDTEIAGSNEHSDGHSDIENARIPYMKEPKQQVQSPVPY
jgi:hypothetical protein